MTREIIAFISLGFGCGPEMGSYGKFSVELTEDEQKQIEEAVASEGVGYKRNYLEENYPELHSKIIAAGFQLAKEVGTMEAIGCSDVLTDEDLEAIEGMTRPEAVEYVLSKDSGLKVDEDALREDLPLMVKYYLTESEIPGDFPGGEEEI